MCLNKRSNVEPSAPLRQLSPWVITLLAEYVYVGTLAHREPAVSARALTWRSDAFHSATDEEGMEKLEQGTHAVYPFFLNL